MRSLRLTKYGKPNDAFAVATVPKPTLDENSSNVLVRVKAASINPVDLKIAQGELNMLKAEKFPAGVGIDLSGIVEKAGKSTGFRPGDEVFGAMSMGDRASMAQYAVLPAQNLAHKPRSLSFIEASTLPVVGLTAFQALSRHQGTKETAFIPAGLGGVGFMALQLAKQHFGFKSTITTVSTAKVALLKEKVPDVDVVVDYKKIDPATVIPAGSVDFVLDPVGPPSAWTKYLRSDPEKKPSIVSIVSPARAEVIQRDFDVKLGFVMYNMINLMEWWTRWWMPRPITFYPLMATGNTKDLTLLADLADKGVLKPFVGKVFPLDKAVEAYELSASGGVTGKVVITMG